MVCRSVGRVRYAATRPCTHWLGPLIGPAAPRRPSNPHTAITSADSTLDAAPDTHARRIALLHEIMCRWTDPPPARSAAISTAAVSGRAAHEGAGRGRVGFHRTPAGEGARRAWP